MFRFDFGTNATTIYFFFMILVTGVEQTRKAIYAFFFLFETLMLRNMTNMVIVSKNKVCLVSNLH